MGCGHGACDNPLSPTKKWIRPMLYKKRLTAERRFPQKGAKIEDKLGLITPA